MTRPSQLPIEHLIEFDTRSSMFEQATRFVDYELIAGDILEFGVYTGRSLALLAHFHEKHKQSVHNVPFQRNIIGFDSFEGLPDGENHPRWQPQMFRNNHSFHPFCKMGERVSPNTVLQLFRAYDFPAPRLEIGPFEIALEKLSPKIRQAAIVHIDCDLYSSTRMVLEWIDDILQDGSILLFDDWFNFKGSPNQGEQKAFWEYLRNTSRWNFVDYRTYATFGKALIAISIERSKETTGGNFLQSCYSNQNALDLS